MDTSTKGGNQFGCDVLGLPDKQNPKLLALVAPQLESFNYAVREGLMRAVADLDPLEFKIPNGPDVKDKYPAVGSESFSRYRVWYFKCTDSELFPTFYFGLRRSRFHFLHETISTLRRSIPVRYYKPERRDKSFLSDSQFSPVNQQCREGAATYSGPCFASIRYTIDGKGNSFQRHMGRVPIMVKVR